MDTNLQHKIFNKKRERDITNPYRQSFGWNTVSVLHSTFAPKPVPLKTLPSNMVFPYFRWVSWRCCYGHCRRARPWCVLELTVKTSSCSGDESHLKIVNWGPNPNRPREPVSCELLELYKILQGFFRGPSVDRGVRSLVRFLGMNRKFFLFFLFSGVLVS